MSRAYSRVEINELGQVIPIYEDEPVNLIIREIEPQPEPQPVIDDYSSAGTRSESESEDEETQYGTWQPDTSCFVPETKPKTEPERPVDLDLWRIGLRNDDAEFVIKFYNERLEKCDNTIKTTANEIAPIFCDWKDDKDRKIPDPTMNYNRILWEFLSSRYGGKNKSKTAFCGVRLKLTEEERERKEAMERAKREIEELEARDKEERLTAQEQFAHPPDTSSDEEPVIKKDKLKDIIDWNGKIIHRHPEYPNYGGDLLTGEIIRLKGNKIDRLVACDLKKGVILSCGSDEDGKRIQKYKSAQLFIAECGRLKGETKYHTKLKINKEYPRPFVRFYPLACLSYEYDGGLDFNGDLHHIKSGNELVSRCKTTKEINDYIDGVKQAFEEKRRNDKTEIAKLKDEIAILKSRNTQLETSIAEHKEVIKCCGLEYQREKEVNRKLNEENSRFSEAQNTPLKAGALQLQQLLMSRHQGSTFLEMLQFCFKDITRDYPKDDDHDFLSENTENDENDGNYATFGQFELSPDTRGLPYDNEHITR